MGKTERIALMMAPAELAAIDNMRFRERVTSRAEAIRQLIERGLRVSTPGDLKDDTSGGSFAGRSPLASEHRPQEGQSAHGR